MQKAGYLCKEESLDMTNEYASISWTVRRLWMILSALD
jgi:hypothetical protein